MSGTGTAIYFIGIIPPVLLAVMLALILLAARERRPRHPRMNPRDGDTGGREPADQTAPHPDAAQPGADQGRRRLSRGVRWGCRGAQYAVRQNWGHGL